VACEAGTRKRRCRPAPGPPMNCRKDRPTGPAGRRAGPADKIRKLFISDIRPDCANRSYWSLAGYSALRRHLGDQWPTMSAYRSASFPSSPVRQSAAAREGASLILTEAEAALDPVARIEGFVLACLVDTATGMILAARKDQDDASLPIAAAGAADIANVLSLLAGELPVDGLEDVMVTFRNQLYVIRLVSDELEPNILLLVILDRARANLALARREIRNFCVNFAA
jgi:hypothetical protein